MEGLIPDRDLFSFDSDSDGTGAEKLNLTILRTRQSYHVAASRKSIHLAHKSSSSVASAVQLGHSGSQLAHKSSSSSACQLGHSGSQLAHKSSSNVSSVVQQAWSVTGSNSNASMLKSQASHGTYGAIAMARQNSNAITYQISLTRAASAASEQLEKLERGGTRTSGLLDCPKSVSRNSSSPDLPQHHSSHSGSFVSDSPQYISDSPSSREHILTDGSGDRTFSGLSVLQVEGELAFRLTQSELDDPTLFNSSLKWLEHDYFKALMIIVISFNIWVLAKETDLPDWPWWVLVNSVFLLAYMLEFALRCAYKGPLMLLYYAKSFHEKVWTWYELSIIVVGVLDLVLSSLCYQVYGLFSCDSPLVRIFQLSRLLRMPRIVYLIPDLYMFVCMLCGMFVNVMVWIFLVIFLFCFVLAIILTRMLGHGMLIHTESDESREVQGMFADIPTSMFTLFQVTTADDWSRIATPVISMDSHPFARFAWRGFFIIFITFMCWTMLSLLTAVASERVLAYTNRKKQEEHITQDLQRQEFLAFLAEEFLNADKDKTGDLDKNEFIDLMNDPDVREAMRKNGINLEERYIERAWDVLDSEELGALEIPVLIEGLSQVLRIFQEGLETKHVASVGYSLKRFSLGMDEDLKSMQENTDKLLSQQQELLQHVRSQQKLFTTQWNRFLQKQSQDALETLEEVEQAAGSTDSKDDTSRKTKVSLHSSLRASRAASKHCHKII